jgi:hypothetical protein
MKTFKARCSGIKSVVTEPKTNKAKEAGELSETTKTLCQEWLKEQLYGRKKEIKAKQIQKGIIVEQDSLDFFAKKCGYGMLQKNEQFYENDFLSGTPDCVLKNKIIDIKSSWDCFSFPLFDAKIKEDYWWQAQGYMELLNIDKFELVYVLMDTPDNIIEREAKSLSFNYGYDVDEVYEELLEKMKWDDISETNLRIKIYKIERDFNCMETVKNNVLKCRKYIDELLQTLK